MSFRPKGDQIVALALASVGIKYAPGLVKFLRIVNSKIKHGIATHDSFGEY